MGVQRQIAAFLRGLEGRTQVEKRISELDERMVTWLVGIASGTLAILVTRSPEGSDDRLGAVMLAMAIVCGIGHRIAMREAIVRDTKDKAISSNLLQLVSESEDAETLHEVKDDQKIVEAQLVAIYNLKPGVDIVKQLTTIRVLRDDLVRLANVLFYCCAGFFVSGGLSIIAPLFWVRDCGR